MKSFVKTVRSNDVLQAALCIAFGLLLVIMPASATLTLVYLLGGYCLISGIVPLVTYLRTRSSATSSPILLFQAVAYLAAALIVFLFPQAIASIFSLLLGLLLLLGGGMNIARSLTMRDASDKGWLVMLVVSVLVTGGGIVILLNPFATTVMFVTVLGILLMVKGASDLVMGVMLDRSQNRAIRR